MSLTRKVAHNTLYQVLARGIGTLLGLVVIRLLTGYLGAEGYGRYTTVFSYVQLFSILADFGLYVILVKKISEPGADVERLSGNFFTIRLLASLVLLGLAPLIALFIPQYPLEVKLAIPIMSLSFLFVTLVQLLTGVFQQKLETYKVAIAEIVSKVVLLLGTIIAVWFHVDFLLLITAVSIAQVANFLVTYIFIRRYFPLRLYFDFRLWREIMRDAFPIAISVSLNLIYFKADTIILTLFRPDHEIGIYGAPYKILEVVITVPSIFVGLVLPILAAHYASQNMEAFRKVYQKAWDFLLMLALPLVFGSLALAPKIIFILTKEKFQEFIPSINVLRILVIAVGIIFLGTLFGHLIVAINQQRRMIWNYFFVAVTSLIGYLIFIPRFTYFGAAWMTVYAEATIMLLALYLVWKTTKFFPSLQKTGKIFLASAVMGGILYWLRDGNIVVVSLLGVALYGGLLYVMKAISWPEIREIIQLKTKST